MVRNPVQLTTDYTDNTDKKKTFSIHPCYPCNPWFIVLSKLLPPLLESAGRLRTPQAAYGPGFPGQGRALAPCRSGCGRRPPAALFETPRTHPAQSAGST